MVRTMVCFLSVLAGSSAAAGFALALQVIAWWCAPVEFAPLASAAFAVDGFALWWLTAHTVANRLYRALGASHEEFVDLEGLSEGFVFVRFVSLVVLVVVHVYCIRVAWGEAAPHLFGCCVALLTLAVVLWRDVRGLLTRQDIDSMKLLQVETFDERKEAG